MNAKNISIPIAKPWITDLEERYVAEAVRSAWGKKANVYNDRFEQAFADFIGRRFAVSLPSCTSALHLSLAALGIGSGDEVIIPDITWIASSAPVEYVGAKPVFVDIDEASWCIDARKFEAALTPSTKAIIVVDLYGGLADMSEIERIAAKNGVAVIEDAAEAFGALQCGRAAGAFGVASTFSFHGSKTMTTGEGGMLLTDDPDLYARVLFLRDHGRRPGDISFRNEEVAFKYRMSSLQAALGLAQLERADELIAKKNEIFNVYSEEFETYKDFVSLNPSLPDTSNAYWMTTAMFNPETGIDKVKAMALFAADGIATRPFFDPLSSIPAYAECESIQGAERQNTVSYRMAPFGINLPSGPMLSIDDVRQVCASLKRILTSPT